MTRGTKSSRQARVAGGASLLVVTGAAVALTGAAFLTVQQASCADPGSYIRTESHVEFVGGCIDPSDIPGARPAKQETVKIGITGQPHSYAP